jgi:tRNA(Ile)-lysidine synthase
MMARRTSIPKTVAQEFTDRLFESIKSLGAANQRVVAAVSGGPDSTALVLGLAALRDEKELEVSAAHANHALRGADSDGDEQFVRELCRRLNVPLVCRRLPVAIDSAERDEGIEATARELRQQFFADAAGELGASFVATAHTADDQAETVLHRIVRGTGLAGLAGIPASRPLDRNVRLIRPLLGMRRADVLEYLAAAGQDAREDRSNRDLAFTRNRLRHELIPYLAQHFNPQITPALARLAAMASDAQAVIDGRVARLLRRAVTKRERQAVVLSVRVLRRAEPFVLCELFRRLWAEQQWPMQEIGYTELAQLAALAANGRPGDACDLPGGVHARCQRDQLVLTIAD